MGTPFRIAAARSLLEAIIHPKLDVLTLASFRSDSKSGSALTLGNSLAATASVPKIDRSYAGRVVMLEKTEAARVETDTDENSYEGSEESVEVVEVDDDDIDSLELEEFAQVLQSKMRTNRVKMGGSNSTATSVTEGSSPTPTVSSVKGDEGNGNVKKGGEDKNKKSEKEKEKSKNEAKNSKNTKEAKNTSKGQNKAAEEEEKEKDGGGKKKDKKNKGDI